MCSEEPRDPQEAINKARQNWRDYDAPFFVKLRLAIRNLWKKARTGQTCCGNYGEPGC